MVLGTLKRPKKANFPPQVGTKRAPKSPKSVFCFLIKITLLKALCLRSKRSREHPGGYLETVPGAIPRPQEPLEAVLSPTWSLLGASWGPPGANLGWKTAVLDPLYESKTMVFTRVFCIFVFWTVWLQKLWLREHWSAIWGLLGASWAARGPLESLLGLKWRPPGGLLRPSWWHLGPSWEPKKRLLGPSFGPKTPLKIDEKKGSKK